MAEFICLKCGQRVQGAECPHCRAATAIATPEHAEQAKVTPAPSSDAAIRAGDPSAQPASEHTASTRPADDAKSKPTVAGCFLTLICVAVIFGSGVPIVTWRNPESGQPLPRMIAIAAPFFAGALCYAVGAAILRVFGIPIFAKTDDDAE